MSLHEERLAEAEQALMVAESNRRNDQLAAADAAEANEARRAYWQAVLNYDKALAQLLESTSTIAQAAHDSARAANKAMDEARAKAETLPVILTVAARVNTAIASLITAASTGPAPKTPTPATPALAAAAALLHSSLEPAAL